MENSNFESGSGMLEENSTWTASCAASTLQAANGSGLPPDVDIAVRVFQVTFTIFRSIFGLMLNALVIALVITSKKLRNASFAIATQIAIVNLLEIPGVSLSIVDNIAGRWIMGVPFCVANAFLSFMLGYTRTTLIFIFSLDRLFSVFIPFHYPKYSRSVVFTLCVLFWCFGFINPLMVIPSFLDCYQYNRAVLSCTYSQHCSHNCEIFYRVLVVHSVPVTILPAVFFTALFIKGRKIRRQVISMTGENKGMTDEDWRAIKTFILLLLPSFLPAIINISPLYRKSSLPFVVKNLLGKTVANIASLVVVVDPIIILRNADVKETLNAMMEKIKGYCKV